MATKAETSGTSDDGIVSIFYRPEREIPPRRAPIFLDINPEPQQKPSQRDYLRFAPGRNRITVKQWKQVCDLETGKQFLKLGVFQEVAAAEKPIGERPGPEDLKNLPIESAVTWVEFESSLFVLKAWQGDDYRGEIQKAIQQRIAELREGKI